MSDRDIGQQNNPEPPEPAIVAHCAYCDGNGEIYAGQYFGYDGKSCICEDCIDKRLAKMPIAQKMYLFGYSYVSRM